jgi:hypothetical protein
LHASKGTNHEDSSTETFPESVETNIGVDFSSGFTGFVHDRDHSVSWMRYNSAENTCNITRHESDHELGTFAVLTLWLGENISVEFGNNLFESNKLNNGVWDLSSPKWLDTLVETGSSFLGVDDLESLNSGFGEFSWGRSLHSNLDL